MIIKSIDRLNIKQYFHYFSNVETETFQKIESRDEFRAWLAKNHAIENECYAIVKRGRPTNDDTFWYIDAVEEALCFGWIDSKVKSFGNGMLMQRFSPRRKSCNWSELNKERCRRMEKLGLMTESGRSILPDISSSNFVISTDILSALQGNEGIWENFQKFPPLYKRVRIDTIQSMRNYPKIFQIRLQKFLDKTKSGIMYGEWNDYGRLLNY